MKSDKDIPEASSSLSSSASQSQPPVQQAKNDFQGIVNRINSCKKCVEMKKQRKVGEAQRDAKIDAVNKLFEPQDFERIFNESQAKNRSYEETYNLAVMEMMKKIAKAIAASENYQVTTFFGSWDMTHSEVSKELILAVNSMELLKELVLAARIVAREGTDPKKRENLLDPIIKAANRVGLTDKLNKILSNVDQVPTFPRPRDS